MARPGLKTSEKTALCALGLGALVALGWWWLWPGSYWWWLLLLTVMVGASAYEVWIKIIAAERLADRDFDPRA